MERLLDERVLFDAAVFKYAVLGENVAVAMIMPATSEPIVTVAGAVKSEPERVVCSLSRNAADRCCVVFCSVSPLVWQALDLCSCGERAITLKKNTLNPEPI